MNETNQPVFESMGYDSLVSVYGAEAVRRTESLMSSRIREKGNLAIVVLKPGCEDASSMLSAIADVHLRITEEHGVMIVYGIKPRTNMYVVEMDASKGYALPRLTPLV
jgi:hypothetical protein